MPIYNKNDTKQLSVMLFNVFIYNLYTTPEHIKGEVTANVDFYGLRVDILCSFCALFLVICVTSLLTYSGSEICCKRGIKNEETGF